MDEATLSQQLMEIIIPVATTVVGLLTSFLLAYLSKWLKSKTDNETITFAYDQAQGIIKDVVAKINQAVKTAGADGKITEEEAQKIKRVALDSVNQQLPPAVKVILEKAVGDLQTWIDTQIEASVYYMKNGNG